MPELGYRMLTSCPFWCSYTYGTGPLMENQSTRMSDLKIVKQIKLLSAYY